MKKRNLPSKKPRMPKWPRRLNLARFGDNVDRKSYQSESSLFPYEPLSCVSFEVEGNTLANSAPLERDVEVGWMHTYEVDGSGTDVVLNRHSFAMNDMLSTRLNGCRAAVPTSSHHSLLHPNQNLGVDVSFSTFPIFSHSTQPSVGMLSEIGDTSRARASQEAILSTVSNSKETEKISVETRISSGEGDNDRPIGKRLDGDIGRGEGASFPLPPCEATFCSTFQLENSTSLNGEITPVEKRGTFLRTPCHSSSSSPKKGASGGQRFSTWKFPVLGNVELAANTTLEEYDDNERGEKAAEANTHSKKPPSKVDAITSASAHDDDNGDAGSKKKEGKSTDEKKSDPGASVANGDKAVGGDSKHYLSGSSRHQHHMKRFRFVYDVYLSLISEDGDDRSSLLDRSDNGVRHSTSFFVPSGSSAQNAVLPSSYYSLGAQRGFEHPNKQIVQNVSPLLHSITNRQYEDLQRSHTEVHDPRIVAMIERRLLLQTTLFAEFQYQKIRQQIKQRHGDEPIVSQCAAAEFRDNGDRIPERQEEVATELGVDITGISAGAEGHFLGKSSSVSGAYFVYEEAAGTTGEGGPAAGILPVPMKLKDELAPKTHCRALTQVRSWKEKVHTIDGISRRVDNENDDLVVGVSMILMGWLEVVDLLGAGTFGQVFLCKDLRIAGPRFWHPGEIEGQDFQYWQCSHEYIPFGDPSLIPTHPPLVAVKVVKSRALFERQSVLEAEMLVYIGAQTAFQGNYSSEKEKCNESLFSTSRIPISDPRCQYITKIYAHGVCYGHHCIVMERYGANLFEYVQANNYGGLPMYHIQSVGRMVLSALTLLHEECHVVHCDIKPENVLLTLDSCFSSNSKRNSGNAGDTRATMESSGVFLVRSLKMSLPNSFLDASTPCTIEASLHAPSVLRTHPVVSLDKRQSPGPNKGSTRLGGRSEDLTNTLGIPSLHIKLIDFSSSCYIRGHANTYLQSRYYRAPEVILAAGYGPPIDIWSTGCLLAELLLGLPLLPGSCDYHQLYLIEEMLGPLPVSLLKSGTHTSKYYGTEGPENNKSRLNSDCRGHFDKLKRDACFHLLTESEYVLRQENAPTVEWRCYFQYRTLADLVRRCPLSTEERRIAIGLCPTAVVGESTEDMTTAAGDEHVTPDKAILDEMMQQRFWLYDLLKRMLHGDPSQRLTARQALSHCFFSYAPEYMKPFLASEE